ncbi:MAG: hypothetical protein WC429_11540, partial [Verrucomicrobiia bacterium]
LLIFSGMHYSLNLWHVPTAVFRFLIVAGLILGVWLVVGLVRLKSTCRRVCVAIFYCSTILFGSLLVMVVLSVEPSSYFKHSAPVFLVLDLLLFASMLIPIILNILSIRYLSRRSFREFARQFVEEREKLERPRAPSN